MRVIKRGGDYENVSFDKVLNRIRVLAADDVSVDICEIAQKVCGRIFDGVRTSDLDELAAQLCSSMMVIHPDYGKLASRIIISNHHKNTSPSFSETIHVLYHNFDVDGRQCPIVSQELYEIVQQHKEKLNSYIDYTRDYAFDYFGFKTLERSYLLRSGGRIIERPQHMWMRVAIGIHGGDIKDALQTYDMLSNKFFTHATPTLFNAGTPRPQNSSCFLLSMKEDSVAGIFDSLKEVAMISKHAGGIGIHIHQIRARGSMIRGNNGVASGIVPMLRVYNNTARYVDQAGKRLGSIACFCENTEVFTVNEGIKPIQDVKIGDLVITHKNRVRPVSQVHKNPLNNRKIYKLEVEKTKPIYVTGNHKFWSFSTKSSTTEPEPAWNSVEDLNGLLVDHYACYVLHSFLDNESLTNQQLKILNITETDRTDEYVYTLGVEEDHSYTVEGLLVENCYLEPWHADVESFLELRKNHGNEEDRCRDLFLALWVPDLFMKRVRENLDWSLMCPDRCRGLSDVWGEEFEKLYENYEKQGMFVRQVKAQDLWFKILESQIETGVPYICYKDAGNAKSNQQNIGTIKSSNLCVAPETMILTEGGYFPIAQLKDQKLRVWNGEEFSMTTVKQTGVQQKLLRVSFSNGMEIRCTPYHKFYIQRKDGKVDTLEAKDLTKGDTIPPYQIPILRDLHGSIEDVVVPINSDFETRLTWLDCYFAVTHHKEGEIVIENKDFLTQIFFMLQTMGVGAQVTDVGDGMYKLVMDMEAVHSCDKDHRTETVMMRDVVVTSIKDLGEEDDTYCFNEPIRHSGVFNGILTSNCTEIFEVSTPEEIAVCNLASLCLPTYVEKNKFNFEKLHDATKVVTKNLNKIIDRNFYPLENAKTSNLRHRPIGIGVQGLADVFMMMRMPYESEEAMALNRHIFETIYHGALECSMELSKRRQETIQSGDPDKIKLLLRNEYELGLTSYPGAYSTFDGSPASKGILQFDMWGIKPTMYEWDKLKEDIKLYGIRNSLLLAPMPTASTAQIMGFNESFEPITNNIFKRKTLSGEFIMVNKYLITDLTQLGLWDKEMKDRIILHDGSVQNIPEIPEKLRALYKTVWEIKQKCVLDMAADRGAFICQSQSLNIFMEDPDFKKLTSMHFYGWQKGLKTGSYYLRTRPKAKTQQFTIEPEFAKQNKKKVVVCDEEVCMSCSA